MKPTEVNRFNELYQRHLRLLKLQGKSQKTIDAYSRAVRRVSDHFDCCPDQLTPEQLETYFGELVEYHSWSTVKIDRNGLQFFWRHVLKRDWQWINIIKPPKIHTIPDILTPTRNRTAHRENPQTALSCFFINHLFNGPSSGRSLIPSGR